MSYHIIILCFSKISKINELSCSKAHRTSLDFRKFEVMQLQSRVQRAKSETKEVHTPPSLPMQRRFGLTTGWSMKCKGQWRSFICNTKIKQKHIIFSVWKITSLSLFHLHVRDEFWDNKVVVWTNMFQDIVIQCILLVKSHSGNVSFLSNRDHENANTNMRTPKNFHNKIWESCKLCWRGWSVKRVGVLDSAVDCWPNRFPKWGVPTWGLRYIS